MGAAAGYQQNIVAIQSQIVDAVNAWNESTKILKSMKRSIGELEKERDALNTRQKFLEAKEKHEQIVLLNALCERVGGLAIDIFVKPAREARERERETKERKAREAKEIKEQKIMV